MFIEFFHQEFPTTVSLKIFKLCSLKRTGKREAFENAGVIHVRDIAYGVRHLQTADCRLQTVHLGLNSTLVSLNSTQVSLNSTQVSLFTVSYW